jgi:hypothetical protein
MKRWIVGQDRRRTRSAIAATVATVALLVVGVDSAWAGNPTTSRVDDDSVEQFCPPFARFRGSNFPHPTRIDSDWYPLVPGTQLSYQGRVTVGSNALPHTVVFTVTDLVKVIDGIPTRVLWDVDSTAGEVVEAELAFFAQDKRENVWAVGEYPEQYENGTFTGAPNTWITGQDDAKAGVLVPGHPRLETPRFLQGIAPEIDFLDCAQVFAMGQKTCESGTCYENVLVMDENSPLDPSGGHQRKFYAPEVGVVRISAVDDPQAETLVLTSVVHLDRAALAQARAAALKLDRHGYQVSKVYRSTPPAFQECSRAVSRYGDHIRRCSL